MQWQFLTSSLSKNALAISLLLLNCFNKVHKLYGTQINTSKFASILEEIFPQKTFLSKKGCFDPTTFFYIFF